MPFQNLGHTRGVVATSRLRSSEPLTLLPVFGPEHEFRAEHHLDSEKWLQAGTVPLTSVATTALNEFLAFEISLVPEVEAVFTAFRNEVFYVWVIVSRFEQDVRARIYDRQRVIIDEFPTFEFDFYVIAGLGRDPWELVSESVTLAFKRRG
jgi:hypothetical protein